MSLLSKKDILKTRVTGFREFDSKELGGKVRFKKLSALGHDAIENYTVEYAVEDGKVKQRKRDFTYFRAAYIAFSQVDENDNLFWDGDVDAVGALDVKVIDELFGFALEANPPAEPIEEVKNELVKNPEGSSSTG
jgi:hypothetical protein